MAIARVRHEVEQAIRDYFYQEGFTLVDTPILTGAIGEEAGNLFATDYFDLGKAYLAQTGQLYVEAAAAALGKVYCFGPTFRAEKSKTRRHLTEFWMVEPEVAFNDSDANMRLQESFVSFIVARVLDRRKQELAELERDTAPLERVQAPFPRVSYSDAVAKLNALAPTSDGAPTSAATTRPCSPRSTTDRSSSSTIPGGQGVLHEAEPGRPRARCWTTTASRPKATARSSAARSARMTTTGCWPGSTSRVSIRRPTAGTSTCGSSGPS